MSMQDSESKESSPPFDKKSSIANIENVDQNSDEQVVRLEFSKGGLTLPGMHEIKEDEQEGEATRQTRRAPGRKFS